MFVFRYINCFGSSVIINNTIYNSSNNTGIENLTTINGCDSIINIIVTEKTEIIFQIDTSICENDSIYFNNSFLHLTILLVKKFSNCKWL